MALPFPYVAVEEQWAGRSATANEKFQRTYTRTFRVEIDRSVQQFGPYIAASAPGLPLLYSYYQNSDASEVDLYSVCKSIKPTQQDTDPCKWLVTCEYGPLDEHPRTHGNPQGGQQTPPHQRPPSASWSMTRYTKALLIDRSGNPVVNSAYDRFDPPLDQMRRVRVLTVTQNELLFVTQQADSFIDKLNDAPFLGYDAGYCKVEDISADKTWEAGFGAYWKVKYVFHFRVEEPWNPLRVLDIGFNCWQPFNDPVNLVNPPAAPKKGQILDKDSHPYSSPSLLDGFGNPLIPAVNPPVVPPVPKYREFDVYDYADFEAFGFNLDYLFGWDEV